ncbi:MAG: MFS transporter [Deltaproteobacteria bacterium]|nr:MFS transporter [Deltaproteobacteria bacterium]
MQHESVHQGVEEKWMILASVACGTFMATLDSSIVNVALPSITLAFKTTLSHSRWVVISYLFSITGLLLFFGKLADVIGRKVVFNAGFLIFTFGCLLCALSGTIDQLIVARGLQGFGAAMIMANGPAIITAAFPTNERGKALGTLAMVVSAGLALGPPLGGMLVNDFGWPSIFFVNIPFGLLGAFLVHQNVPTLLGMSGTIEDLAKLAGEHALPRLVRAKIYLGKLQYFDWLGVIMWMFIQFGYSLAIDRENALGLAGPLQKMVSFGSGGLLLLFLLWEWSVNDPVLNLSLFRSRLFLASNVAGLFNFIAVSAITLLLPFYLQNVREFKPQQVGLIMTTIPLTIFIVAPISGRLSDIYDSRLLATAGMALLCLAMALLALPNSGLSSTSPTSLIFDLMLVGAGIGLFQSPNNNSIMGAVPRSHLGVASALLATVRNFGLVTGAAMSTGLLMHYYHLYDAQSSLRDVHASSQNFIIAMRHTFMALAAICSLGIFTSMTRGPRPDVAKN